MKQEPYLCKDDIKGQFKILKDGTWMHEGRPIKRQKLVSLFATILRKEVDENGSFEYALRTPHEVVSVEVEDAPFLIVDLEQKGVAIHVTTNIDKSYIIGDDYPVIIRNQKPYMILDHGVEAKFTHGSYYNLCDMADSNLKIKSNNYEIKLI